MQPIKITAHLSTNLAVMEDYSPALESILEAVWLDMRGLLRATPDPNNLYYPELPFAKSDFFGQDYWMVSAPHYLYLGESVEFVVKRWQGENEGHPVEWGKTNKKIQTDGGKYKSLRKPVFTRMVPSIGWYAVGDAQQCEAMLQFVTSVGAYRAAGYGQVLRWEVEPVVEDWHFLKNGGLMRPVPLAALPDGVSHRTMQWAWRSPFQLSENRALCAMPVANVQKPQTVDWFEAAGEL